MKILLTLFSILPTFLASAQIGHYFFGDTGDDFIYEMTPSADSHLYAIGTKTVEASRIWLVKMNLIGEVLWEKTFEPDDQTKNERGFSVNVFADGSLILTGDKIDPQNAQKQISVIIKTDAHGNEIWRHSYVEASAFFDAAPQGNGILFCGWHDDTGSGESGILMWTDSSGIQKRRREITVYNQNYIKKILELPNDHRIIVGRTNNIGAGFHGMFVSEVDGAMKEVWIKTYHTNFRQSSVVNLDGGIQPPMGAHRDEDGSLWIAQSSFTTGNAELFHLNADGTLIDQKSYGSQHTTDIVTALTPLDSNTFLISGFTTGKKAFAIKVKETGFQEWIQYYTWNNADIKSYGAAVSGDHYLVYGRMLREDRPTQDYDGWILRMEQDGNIKPYSITGSVVLDENRNCQYDENEKPIPSWFLNVVGPTGVDTIIVGRDGRIDFTSFDGYYEITLLNRNTGDWIICEPVLQAETNTSQQADTILFLVQRKDDCAAPAIYLAQPELTRCDTSCLLAAVTNEGSEVTDEMALTITYDPKLTLTSASEVFTTLNNESVFEIDPVEIFEVQHIEMCFALDCDVQLGATHEIKAELNSIACTAPYSGPSFKVQGRCHNNQVEVYLSNTGGGGDQVFTTYSVFADGVIILQDEDVQLPEGGNPQQLLFPADGRTWHIEVLQPINAPKRIDQSTTIQGCGVDRNGLFDVSFANAHHTYQQDIATIIRVPNTVGATNVILNSISGFGWYNLITEDGEMQYTARCINYLQTTTQRVSFELTFNSNIDITSFRLLAAPANAIVTLLGFNTVSITFNDVELLPGESIMYRFALSPKPALIPDDPVFGVMEINGQFYLNEEGPFPLTLAYNQYSQTVPAQPDPFLVYPEGITTYGGWYWEFGMQVAEGINGELFYGVQSASFTGSYYENALIIKLDQAGRVIWQRSIDTEKNGINSIVGITGMADGGCIFTGNYTLPGIDHYIGTAKTYVVRLDADGNEIWLKYLPTPSGSTALTAMGLVPANDGNYIIHGGGDNTEYDQFYWKINPEGEVLWLNFPLIENKKFYPRVSKSLTDGSVISLGDDNAQGFLNVLEKLDKDGNILWNKPVLSTYDAYFTDITETHDGNLLLVGGSIWNNGGDQVQTPTFLKLTPTGEVIWEKSPIVGDDQRAEAKQVVAMPDQHFMVGGNIFTTDPTHNFDVLMMRIDADGEVQWYKHYGTKRNELCTDIFLHSDGHVYLAGDNQIPPPFYNMQAILIKTDANGQLVDLHEPTVKNELHSVHLFPNPAGDYVHIILSETNHKEVNWILMDATGRMVKHGLMDAKITGEIDVNDLPQGIYYLTFPGSLYPTTKIIKM